MRGKHPVLSVASLGLVLFLAAVASPTLAQDKSACQAYFQVVQMDARIAGGLAAGGNDAQKKWWEKKGERKYAGLCWNGAVLSGDKPRYLLIWLSENNSKLVDSPTTETSEQPITGTVTDTYGQTVGTIDGTTRITTTTHQLSERNWTTASISVVQISSEGKIELPAIYFHTADPSAGLLGVVAPNFVSLRASASQQALEGALKFLKERDFIPVGVTTSIAEDAKPASTQPAPTLAAEPSASVGASALAASGTGTVKVLSIPPGADVYVDGRFVGNSPAELQLSSGTHTVAAKKTRYQDWSREITVYLGTVDLNPELAPLATTHNVQSETSTKVEPSTAVNSETRAKTQNDAEPNGDSGWIGVTTIDDATRGLVITRVLPGSDASQAGLQVGDVILELNGTAVKLVLAFDVAIAHSKVGSQIRISYLRGAWKSEVVVTVGKIA